MAHALRASATQLTPGEERREMAWSPASVGGQVLLQKVLTEVPSTGPLLRADWEEFWFP